MSLSTHVLDTSRGEPARGLAYRLERVEEGRSALLVEGRTDEDGRGRALVAPGALEAGTYRLCFLLDEWFAARGEVAFYPEAAVLFRVRHPEQHHHIPLLLSPFGYTTYRGS